MENGARRGGAADEVQGREDLSMAGLGSLPKQAAVIWDFSWGYGTHKTVAFICLRRSTQGTTDGVVQKLDFDSDQPPWRCV